MFLGTRDSGACDPRVIEKVKAACEEGLTFGAPTEREVEMAELLAQLVPSMEVSRLVSSGTEATMSAIPCCAGDIRSVTRSSNSVDVITVIRNGLLVKAGSAALSNICSGQCGCSGRFYQHHTLVAEYNSPGQRQGTV